VYGGEPVNRTLFHIILTLAILLCSSRLFAGAGQGAEHAIQNFGVGYTGYGLTYTVLKSFGASKSESAWISFYLDTAVHGGSNFADFISKSEKVKPNAKYWTRHQYYWDNLRDFFQCEVGAVVGMVSMHLIDTRISVGRNSVKFAKTF
jgi:hypothetical protein